MSDLKYKCNQHNVENFTCSFVLTFTVLGCKIYTLFKKQKQILNFKFCSFFLEWYMQILVNLYIIMLEVSYFKVLDIPPGKCEMHLVWKTDFLRLFSMAFSTHHMTPPIFYPTCFILQYETDFLVLRTWTWKLYI